MAGAVKTCLICIGLILIILGIFIFRTIVLVIIGVVLFIVGICSSRKASKSLDKTPITKTTPQPASVPPLKPTPQKAPEQKAESPRYCSLCGAKTTGEYCPDCGAKVE
ncbi:MAG: hypothetical protein ACFFHV_20840 [Promethearchaeota archaeon]